MKHLFITTCFIVALFISPAGYSQDLIIGNDRNTSVVSGTITKIGREELTLQIDDRKFLTIDTDDMDIEEGYMDDVLSVGTKIKVIGKFDDDVLEADKIIRLDDDSDILIYDN